MKNHKLEGVGLFCIFNFLLENTIDMKTYLPKSNWLGLAFSFLLYWSYSNAQDTLRLDWTTTFGGSQMDAFQKATPTSDGGFVLAGTSNSTDNGISTNGNKDVWIIKIDAAGNQLWQQTYGGSADDEGLAVVELDNQELLVLGTSWSSDGDIGTPIGANNANIWLLRLDMNGALLEEELYGGMEDDFGADLYIDTNNDVWVLANVFSSFGNVDNQGGQDIAVFSVQQQTLSVLQSMGYGDQNDEAAWDIKQTQDGGYIICGQQVHPDEIPGKPSRFYFLKTDPDLLMQWDTSYGGTLPDIAVAIEELENGNFWVWGHSCSNNGDVAGENIGNFDFCLLELNPTGGLLSTHNYGGTDRDIARDFYLKEDGRMLVFGETSSSDQDIEMPRGGVDYWIGLLNATGDTLEWTTNLGGTGDDLLLDASKNDNDRWLVLGHSASADGDVGTNAGETDGWVLSFDQGCIDDGGVILGSRTEDSLALVTLYELTNGPYWENQENWLSAAPLEQWYGVETKALCSTGDLRVTGIYLADNNLGGTVYPYIDEISYLEQLHLNDNEIKNLGDLFIAPAWEVRPLPFVNVNHNQIRYDDLLRNACIFSDSSQYWQQQTDLRLEYRHEFDFPPAIPTYADNENESGVDYLDGLGDPLASAFATPSYSWQFAGNPVPGMTEATFDLDGAIQIEEGGLYVRTAHYAPAISDQDCPLDSVEMHNPIFLNVLELDFETSEEYIPTQIIIHFNDTTTQQTIQQYEDELEALGGTKIKECPCGPTIQLWAATLVDLESVRMGAQSKAGIDTTEFNYLYPYLSKDKILPFNSTGFIGLLVEDMQWDDAYFFQGPQANIQSVRVGVIDSGVNPDVSWIEDYIWQNPELQDTLNCVLNDVVGYDFVNNVGNPVDRNNHGTPINGIIASNYPNQNLELINGKFFDEDYGQLFEAVCAMHYVMDEGVQIMNLSWGYIAPNPSFILEEAIQRAFDQDIFIVTSSGNASGNNFGHDLDNTEKWPANFSRDYENIIVVGAYERPDTLFAGQTYVTDQGDMVTLDEDLFLDTLIYPIYANYGDSAVHLAAPGTVNAPNVNGLGFSPFTGTSMAAPYITRAVAIAKNEFPDLTNAEIKDCLLSSVDSIPHFDTLLITSGIHNFDNFYACLVDQDMLNIPIELSGAWQANGAIRLEWSVAESRANYSYRLQKSPDGLNWRDVETLPGQAFSEPVEPFILMDLGPHFPNNHYRVLLERAGKVLQESNSIEVVSATASTTLVVYPNPTSENEMTVHSAVAITDGIWQLTDMHGQALQSGPFDGTLQTLQIGELAPGIYLISVHAGNGTFTQKFYKH